MTRNNEKIMERLHLVVNLHLTTGTGLGRLAAVCLNVVAGSLGVATGVVRAFQVGATGIWVEGLFLRI